MLLQLEPDYNEQELIDELYSLDTRMLIFLRRLRQINVTIHQTNEKIWQTKLARQDGLVGNERAIELLRDDKKTTYIVTTYQVKNMPPEPKRPGVTESEILLAFPVVPSGDENAAIQPQQVYAFLPIRDYGFQVSTKVFS